jgi:hypothetical protein
MRGLHARRADAFIPELLAAWYGVSGGSAFE